MLPPQSQAAAEAVQFLAQLQATQQAGAGGTLTFIVENMLAIKLGVSSAPFHCTVCAPMHLHLPSAAEASGRAGEQAPNPSPGGGASLPAGALQKDGRVVYRLDAPSFQHLLDGTKFNKAGTAGASRLTETFTLTKEGVKTVVPVAPLWAALRRHGGMHLVSDGCRTGCCCLGCMSALCIAAVQLIAPICLLQVLARQALLAVVRELPNLEGFPPALVQLLTQRLNTWFKPLYGYSEDEELGRLAPAPLKSACCSSLLCSVCCSAPQPHRPAHLSTPIPHPPTLPCRPAAGRLGLWRPCHGGR